MIGKILFKNDGYMQWCNQEWVKGWRGKGYMGYKKPVLTTEYLYGLEPPFISRILFVDNDYQNNSNKKKNIKHSFLT